MLATIMNRLKSVGWIDVGLHVAAAFGGMTLLALLGVDDTIAVVMFTAFGYGREAWQAYRIGREVNPVDWSLHKHLEAAAFPVTALAMVMQ